MKQIILTLFFFLLIPQNISSQTNIDAKKNLPINENSHGKSTQNDRLLDSQNQIKTISQTQEAILINEVIYNYLNAPSIQEKAKYVIDSEKNHGKMMKYYDEYMPTKYKLENFVSYLSIGNKNYKAYYEIENSFGGKSMQYLYLTKINSKFYIDWIKSTGYNDINLEEFKENKNLNEIIVRAYVSFDKNFDDDKNYQFYVSANSTSLYTRQEKNSDLGKELFDLLSGTGKKIIIKIQKKLSYENKTLFEITELINTEW